MSQYDDIVNDGEFVEVQVGDYARTLKWEGEPFEFVGTFTGSVTRDIKGDARTIHQFTLEDGEEVESFGTAILDSRLKQVPAGARVKVKYLGKNAKTKRGVLAHNFQVLVARSALKNS